MLNKIESREALSYKAFDLEQKVTAMVKEKNVRLEEWEIKCREAEAEVIICEDLIFFYDTLEMSKRLNKAYNRLRHYDYIYHKLDKECEELEEALEGLKKASYWL